MATIDEPTGGSVIAGAAAAVVYVSRPAALERAGTLGPEFVLEDR
jgi:hypothetical protein